MKKSKRKSIIIGILFLTACGIPYIGEWMFNEINYDYWIKANSLRVDFASFDTTDEAEKAILQKTPIGSSEEKLQAFFLANVKDTSVDDWQVSTNRTYYYCSETQACHAFRFEVRLNNGHLLQRLFGYIWAVSFHLHPDTHELMGVYTRRKTRLDDLILSSIP